MKKISRGAIFFISGGVIFGLSSALPPTIEGCPLAPLTRLPPFLLGGLLGLLFLRWKLKRDRGREQLLHANRILRAIRQVNQVAARAKNRDSLARGICDALVENHGCFSVWLALLDEKGEWRSFAEAGLGENFFPVIDQMKKGEMVACCRKLLSHPEIVVTGEPATLCTDCALAAGYGDCGAMSARLEYGGKIYGLLILSVSKAHIYDPEEKQLVTDVAADIALGLSAMESAKARDSADKALQKSMRDLGERVKELNCLFELSNLEQRPGLSLEEILPGAIRLIPPAFQTPRSTCARITLDGAAHQTDNFRETAWKLEKDIMVNGRPEGRLTVCALGRAVGRAEGRDEPPFLEEEKNLVRVIADRLTKIVEHYRFQTALSVSETRYRELFNNLRNGAIVLEAAPGDADFIIRDLNRAGEIIDGIRREDVIGARLIETFPGIKDSGLYDALWRVYENGRSEQLPDGRFRGGRGERWREYYVYRLPSGEMVALFSDVTEKRLRKEALLASEKRFRALCENSLTGISILQGNRVVYQNKEQERLFGPLPRAHIMIDPDKIHPDDVDEVKGFNRRIASVDNRTGDVHFRYFPGSDKNNPIWISCRTSFIEYQGVESILINIMDMTQTKELELLLFVQDKMASLGRVAAGIAHEIRSPLSGINIYLNTLEKFIARGEREEKIKEIFRHLLSASRKIDSVISRVMDFSKPGQPTFIMMDINQPVEEALKLSSVTLRKCGIQLEKSLAQDPPRCRLDPQRIEEVVLNLIHNAIDALKGVAREKRIMVKTSVEGADMVVRVLDSGPGVPLDDQRKVFDPFYTTKSDSTGIGLSICHRIITDHGGALNVQTSPWGGADFRVSVPLQNTRG